VLGGEAGSGGQDGGIIQEGKRDAPKIRLFSKRRRTSESCIGFFS